MSSNSNEEAHVSEKQYWIVFVILIAITSLEVAWSYLGYEGPALVWPLVGMMILKFVLVAGVFMHLYVDSESKNGKIFWYIFFFGILVALAVYFGVYLTFDLL